jgi:hypothetical protein
MSRQSNLLEGTEVSQCQVGETRELVVQISHRRIDRPTRRRAMKVKSTVYLCILLSAMFWYSARSGSAAVEQQESHNPISGIVTKAPGGLAIKTLQGTTYQVNTNQAKRHGHQPFKEGDQVTFLLNENNAVIDVHLKGQEGEHQYVTGKLIHLGKMQKEIKLATPEGEKIFPLAHLETKTKGIKEGTPVTIEVNEAGAVIDDHAATASAVKP